MALGHGMQDAQKTMGINIVAAWIVTLPAAGAVAAVVYWITHLVVG
jgi:phosphate/sulfate permease